MSKVIRILMVMGLAGLIGLTIDPRPAQADGNPDLPRFEPGDCPFPIPGGERIDCGFLVVPESRAQPTGATIRIHVALVHSHSPTPAPDPIIYLNGGPGGTSQEIIETLPRFQAWLARRDLVLFDPRGTGWSQPALDCPEIQSVTMQMFLGADPTLAEQLAPRRACRDRWLAVGIDLAAYNSVETAADITDLRRALGYEQVNLYAISYGTLVAQLVMRDHNGANRLRSIILDAVVPLSIPAFADTPARVATALQQLFADCAADLICRSAYPNLETIYNQLLDRFEKSSVTMPATNPLTGDPVTFPYGLDELGYMIMYSPYRTFPGMIYDLYEGDYRALIKSREAFIRGLLVHPAGGGLGLRTTIRCNEPWYQISPDQQAAMAVYREARFMAEPLEEALCREWPTFTPPTMTPVGGDVPALILVGERDMRLYAYGQIVAAPLSRGYDYLVPDALHNVLETGGPCPNIMALAFFDDPSQAPDSRCLAAAGRYRFDTRFQLRTAVARQPIRALIGLMSLLVIGMTVTTVRRLRPARSGRNFASAWRASLHLAGGRALLIGGGLVGLTILAAQAGLLPIEPAAAVGLVLPITAAVQAAYLLSPDDEPGLEILLAAPRPMAWLLLERLAVLFLCYSGIALLGSLYLTATTGEPLPIQLMRGLPLMLTLSGLAVVITLALRRALLGALMVSLLWLILSLLGDFMTDHWPASWPFHLYLSPATIEFPLNRLCLTSLGLTLLGLAVTRLINDPERLLLGPARARRTPGETRLNGKGIAVWSPTLRWPVALTKLLAIIGYEFRLQWRSAALPALVAGLTITPLLGAVVAFGDFQGYRGAVTAGTMADDVLRSKVTGAMGMPTWLGLALLAIIFIPPLAAEIIPRDRQAGVRELLDALPLPPGLYLLGKLLSLWLNLTIAVAAAALTSGLAWWLLIGPFDLVLLLDIWFVGGLGLCLINAGFSLLLAAPQPTTRRAVLVGAAFSLLCLIGVGLLFAPQPGWWQWFNPARPAVMLHYMLGLPGTLTRNDDLTRAVAALVARLANRQAVFTALGTGLAQVGLIWLMMWQWLKRI